MQNNKAKLLESTTPLAAELSLTPYQTSEAEFTTSDSAVDIEPGTVTYTIPTEEDGNTVVFTINRVFMDGSVTYTASVYSLVDGNDDPVTGYTTTSTEIILPALGDGEEYDIILDATPNPSTVGGQTKPVRRGSGTIIVRDAGGGG